MSIYDGFIARMEASGTTPKKASENVTRRNQISLIMNSPSRSEVRINDGEALPCLVSDIETFNKRRFLFLPDTEISIGDYVYHEDKVYLSTDRKTDPVYPELFGELCNGVFRVNKGTTRIDTGERDWQGRPIYEYIEEIEDISCVFTTNVYSALSNSPIPLPSGAMIAKIPYDTEIKIPLNHIHRTRDTEYKVIDVKYEYVIDEVGYIEVHMQRTVDKDE